MKGDFAAAFVACLILAASCQAEIGKPKLLTLQLGKLRAVLDAGDARLVKLAPVSGAVPIGSEGGRLADLRPR